ncbi:putative sporulation protein YtxC [Paenibacillus anaericanus]|uniref:putative sporulation protein YtxC n=1 Tax=Paenibacillus anaericanus TaxID=170367 RepID=UPI002783B6AD|nr:putative sporulation protein YtxC [Paenibacillus anaericanus]MDQ0087151.1 putative sporulation protein YtxC [Paenibacillus anaericanus]
MDFFVICAKLDSAESGNLLPGYIDGAIDELYKGKERTDTSYTQDGKLIRAAIAVHDIGEGDIPRKEWNVILLQGLAQALAKYIVDVREAKIVAEVIATEYSLSSPEQLKAVKELSSRLLGTGKDSLEARNLRIMGIKESCFMYLKESKSFHVDGFITFRLKDYKSKLKETVDFAVDEYLLDKQYEEFIGLLQYFVYFQEPLTPLVHLMHIRGSEFSILNQEFATVSVSAVSGVVARIADQELEMEDIVVSTLISLSPSRIVIHTRDPEVVIISTIRRIFGDRVELCLLCPQCNLIHQGARHSD